MKQSKDERGRVSIIPGKSGKFLQKFFEKFLREKFLRDKILEKVLEKKSKNILENFFLNFPSHVAKIFYNLLFPALSRLSTRCFFCIAASDARTTPSFISSKSRTSVSATFLTGV